MRVWRSLFSIIRHGVGLTCRLVKVLAVVTVKLIVAQLKRPSTTFGSARFASRAELKAAGLDHGAGLLIGDADGLTIRQARPQHVLLTAPTDGRKTSCFILPNLLTLGSASAVVNDPDGEAYGITRRAREKNGPAYLWAPFAERSHSWNPLDTIRAGTPDEVDDARLVAQLVMEPEKASDAYWDREAEQLLVAMILYVLHGRGVLLRSMAEVHHLLSLSPAAFDHVLERMIFSGHPVCRKVANSLRSYGEEQLGGILGSVRSHTQAFHSPRLQAVTGYSDFSFSDLRELTGTVYVVVPPEQAASFRPALRLIHGLALAESRRCGTRYTQCMVFFWDEFASLGRLEPAVGAIAIARKAGIQLVLVIQSHAQLEAAYGRSAETLVANCGTRLSFGAADHVEAKRLSESLGQHTVQTLSSGNHSGLTDMLPERINQGAGEAGRALLAPDEIMVLPPETAIVAMPGLRPIRLRKAFYREAPFAGLWDAWDGTPASLPPDAPLRLTHEPIRLLPAPAAANTVEVIVLPTPNPETAEAA